MKLGLFAAPIQWRKKVEFFFTLLMKGQVLHCMRTHLKVQN